MSESSMIIDSESKMHVSHSNDNVTLSQELEVMIYWVILALRKHDPSVHITSKQRRIDVDTTSWRRIDVAMTLF